MKYFQNNSYLAAYKKISFIIILALGLSCTNSNSELEDRDSRAVFKGYYLKSTKTNLCFFVTHGDDNELILTYVPCTPEVERQVRYELN